VTQQLTPNAQLPYYQGSDLADGATQQQALAQKLDGMLTPGALSPVGSITMWATATAPNGWLLCIGVTVGVTVSLYPQLDALFGHDGSNRILLPDLRDRFPVCAGSTMPLTGAGSNGGSSAVALSTAQMPAHDHNGGTAGKTGAADRALTHSHSISGEAWGAAGGGAGGHVHSNAFNSYQGQAGYAAVDSWFGAQAYSFWVISSDAAPDHLHTIASNGGGGTHENRPPYQALNFIIRAG
jgi:microcystin-dependent protein